MFGVEIRKKNSVKNLYADVDKILANYNIPKGSVSQDVQISTVAHSIQKMIDTKRFFDVCTINNCAKICQIVIPSERMCIYNSIHCLHWNEMLPEYRQSIIAMVLDDFREILNPTE